MALLAIQDLSLGYDSHKIVKDLNFSVNAGDYLCIVGENGSGKTTLMKSLLHLQDPISGQILAGDGLKTNEIGYLPQQTVVQKDFPASVREIVLSGCQGRCGLRPFYNKEENGWRRKTCSVWVSWGLQTGAIGNFPAVSSRECCLPGRSVPQENYCCWMSRYQGLIQK